MSAQLQALHASGQFDHHAPSAQDRQGDFKGFGMSLFFNHDKEQGLRYVSSLHVIARLSKLFSESETPFLHYRVMENLFCQCFNAQNLSRSDTAFDAKIGNFGIGLKTFTCHTNAKIEKIAEFNKSSHILRGTQNPIELAYQLAYFRNERILSARDVYGIQNACYHIIARDHNKLMFFETDYAPIDINQIGNIHSTPKSLRFSDGCNEYYFNYSKSVLQRKFYIPSDCPSVSVQILDNPFDLLLSLQNHLWGNITTPKIAGRDYVILPLYSPKTHAVPERSGLNQWNAGGRARKYGEVYIPVPAQIHQLAPHFFPPRDTPFDLKTPLGQILQAKLCQDNSKALMSNPNNALANWLLKTVLRLQEGELTAYEKMQILGLDCVVIEKIQEGVYSIDIRPLGSYEKFIQDCMGVEFV
ncbi:phospholipase D-like domain-containing protein [Helicobacter felis]|nr:restriction endonuclease [Helicobacter felis]